jgi:predicted Na+-dependent transporter
LGRFALVVFVPLVLGLLARGARPELVRRETELSVASSLAVVVLIYASLSGTRGGDLAAAALISAAFLVTSALLAAVVLSVAGERLDRSLGLAVGMRDFAVAAALAAGAFGAGAAYVAGVYGVLMLLTGATITGVVRRVGRRAR